jgi:long-chain acyl-CoA synthetase
LLCMMRNAPLDSVKLFVNGADMLPDKIRAAFGIVYGRKICAGYGLTESAPLVAVNHENNQRATVVVGYPLCELECDVRDDAGVSVSPNTIGTLWLKGDNIMMGYYMAPESTSRVLVDGWLNTGDLAYLDKQGRLAVCGRTKDVIIHKGFNIYPAEVENVLLTHPAVYKVAVIGQEEASSGQVPVAYVALRKREATIENDLRVLCAQNLASYKVPRKFVCLDDLPMNATGKVDKKQLKQQSL